MDMMVKCILRYGICIELLTAAICISTALYLTLVFPRFGGLFLTRLPARALALLGPPEG